MFICSVRAGPLKFFGAVLLALSLLVTLLVLAEPSATAVGGTADEALETVSYSGIKTDADRVAFLKAFGWEVASETPAATVSFPIPSELDRVLAGYNEIQRAQGLDLGRYRNKTVTRYTYEVTNYSGYEGKVYATLMMYKNKVVAADITSAARDGFVHGLTRPK